MASATTTDGTLTAADAERLVQTLKCFPVEEVGSTKWMAQHRTLEQLNLQAHRNATANKDAFVMEAMATFNGLELLVHELLAVEAWKDKVFPIVKKKFAKKNGMRAYFILYHEVVLANLLEVFLFHEEACETLADVLVDLVDYCCRKVVRLISKPAPTDAPKESAADTLKSIEKLTKLEDLEKRFDEIEFRTSVVAVTMLRYITGHMGKLSNLPLSVMTRILDTHDVMQLVVPLIENPPWTRRSSDGQWQKYEEGNWKVVEPADLLRLTKHEGQAWLILFNLMCDQKCRERYYFHSARKNGVMRIRKYLNEVLLDQLPVLAGVQRYMDELSIMNAPEPTQFAKSSALILEQEAELREGIIAGKDWDAIAKANMKALPAAKDDADLKELADVYHMDAFEDMMGEAKCFVCGKAAEQRCSRCRNAWYCSRKCQVENWGKHKTLCDLVVNPSKKTAEAAQAAGMAMAKAATEQLAKEAAQEAVAKAKAEVDAASAAASAGGAGGGAGAGAGAGSAEEGKGSDSGAAAVEEAEAREPTPEEKAAARRAALEAAEARAKKAIEDAAKAKAKAEAEAEAAKKASASQEEKPAGSASAGAAQAKSKPAATGPPVRRLPPAPVGGLIIEELPDEDDVE